MNKNHMAIDQYGATFHNLGRFPRRELLERLDRKSSKKMYQDGTDQTTFQTGWIIAGLWLSVFEVTPMRRKA